MHQAIQIHTDNESKGFLLKGDIENLLKNSRLLFSLKRLKFSPEEGGLLIPFEDHNKIKILQELQMLMEKFSVETTLSNETKDEVSSFDRERRTFKEFSEKAR